MASRGKVVGSPANEQLALADELVTEAIEAFRQATTGMVVDALMMAGIDGTLPGIFPARGFEDARIVGPATTVEYARVPVAGSYLGMYPAISESAPGRVLVVDGKGFDRNFVGDNMGDFAKRHGMTAVVVWGGARDLAGYRALGLPLFCRSAAVAHRPTGYEVVARDVPVRVGQAVVAPGDIIVGDEDGVVAVPTGTLEKVLDNLKIVIGVEHDLERAIASGAPPVAIAEILSRKRRTDVREPLGRSMGPWRRGGRSS